MTLPRGAALITGESTRGSEAALGESPADSCREVSVIPNYTRAEMTTECYNSFILGRCIDYLDPQLLKYRYRNNMTPV